MAARRPQADTHPTTPAPATGEELVERARALQPWLRAQAERGEADRAVSPAVVDALADAEVFRLLTPRRLGGQETGLRTLMEVSEVLGEADGSTAWTAVSVAVTNRLACRFPERAQDEVFGADPHARVTGATAPTGIGRRVPGGWAVTGRWSHNSAAPYATWAVVGALLQDGTGTATYRALVLVPASELVREDTWHTVGMRGTARHTLIARDIMVPDHRVLSVPAAAGGSCPPSSRPDGVPPALPLGLAPMLSACLVGPLLGLGNAALAAVREAATHEPVPSTVHGGPAGSVGVQIQLAEAALQLRTARLHAYDAVDRIDRGCVDHAERARVRAQAGHAAQHVLTAVDTLLNVRGADAFADTDPLQRIWRDAGIAARHAGLVPAVGYEVYGKALLGIEEPVGLVI
ncbi:acyl-CoA dehydrogenase family protein [Streptomyces sp. NPDC056785]|uniref:acyl-CoA dehydrogenase family protein n=1 Tax=Streptomyces sp. NPDC056785 TaxID=3345944 RepID=UPI003678D786